MTNEILITVLQGLIMGFAFLVPLALCRIADIAFGVASSFKIKDLKFDWVKLVSGIINTLILLAGLACLIAGVTMIPELMKYYNVQILDTDILSDIVDGFMIVSTITISALTYGKDAYVKFKNLL